MLEIRGFWIFRDTGELLATKYIYLLHTGNSTLALSLILNVAALFFRRFPTVEAKVKRDWETWSSSHHSEESRTVEYTPVQRDDRTMVSEITSAIIDGFGQFCAQPEDKQICRTKTGIWPIVWETKAFRYLNILSRFYYCSRSHFFSIRFPDKLD